MQALPSLASYGSHGNLGSLMGLQAQLVQAQAQAQAQVALQLGAAGAGAVPPNAAALDSSSPSQLISLLSANAAVAAAAAAGGGLPPATAGAPSVMLRSSPSMGQLSLSRGSSHNDLVGLLAQQQQQQQQQQQEQQQMGAGKPPLPGGWHAATGLPPMRPSSGMTSVQGTVGPASARAGAHVCAPPALHCMVFMLSCSRLCNWCAWPAHLHLVLVSNSADVFACEPRAMTKGHGGGA